MINAGAVTGYNATSYVDGKLRRQIYNFGYDARGMLLDWPVGDVVKVINLQTFYLLRVVQLLVSVI